MLGNARVVGSINEESQLTDATPTLRTDFTKTDEQTFCVKNYDLPKGLSSKLHSVEAREEREDFCVRGPLGCGLKLHDLSDGKHIAFAAGTGALVFLDLVAYLLRKVVSTKESYSTVFKNETFGLGNKFKFVFYVSFRTGKDRLGQEYCKALSQRCHDHGLDWFEYHERIASESGSPRWDKNWI